MDIPLLENDPGGRAAPATPGAHLLSRVQRPYESRLLRRLWLEQRKPRPAAFDPVVSLARLLAYNIDEHPGLPPSVRIMQADERFALLLSNSATAHIVETIDAPWQEARDISDTMVRVLPGTLHLAGMFTHTIHTRDFRIAVALMTGPKARSGAVTLPTRDPSVDPGLFVPMTSHPIPAPDRISADTLAQLHEEICRIGSVLAAQEADRRNQDLWPVELCRYILPEIARTNKMKQILQDIADHIAMLRQRTTMLGIDLLRPAWDRQHANLRLRYDVAGQIDKDLRVQAEAAFATELADTWPDGWTTLWGPERVRGHLADKHIQKQRVVGNPDTSAHRKIDLLRRFGARRAQNLPSA